MMTHNDKTHNPIRNEQATTTHIDAVDVLEAKAAYKMAYSAAKATMEELQHKLKRLDNLKVMNSYQLKDYQDTKLLIDILVIFTQSSRTVVTYMARNEAQTFNDLAEASATEMAMMQAQQKRIEQLKQELADANELLCEMADKFLSV